MSSEVIIYSSLFPSDTQPVKGLFVSELAKALTHHIDVKVVKPVFLNQNHFSAFRETKKYKYAQTVEVNPSFCFNIPRFFKWTDSFLTAWFSSKAFNHSVTKNTKLVHAHFAYPDAAAALRLCLKQALPLVVTVHGSDINVLAKDLDRRKIIVNTLNQADAVICVSEELIQKIRRIGVVNQQIYHIPNGVDIEYFTPGNKDLAKRKIGAKQVKKLLLTVGNLVPIKGYDNLIRALSLLPEEIGLVMAGSGPEQESLKKLIQQLGLEGRIKFAGAVEHNALPVYYQAADFLIISSHSEGWPTVIFESFACGVPVIANNVGGVSEAVSSYQLGVLMDHNEPKNIADSILTAYSRCWDNHKIISVAQQNSWSEVARRTYCVYEEVLSSFSRK